MKLLNLPYQKEGVKLIHKFNGRVLLADDMGLGKTIEVILWLKEMPKKVPVIVICPAHLKYVWYDAIKGILKKHAYIASGEKPPKINQLKRHRYIIINYDILLPSKKNKKEINFTWVDYLRKQKAKVLIVDECHHQKNRKTKKRKAVKQIAEGIDHIIAISGTPLLSRPSELWTSLNLVRPDLYPSFLDYAIRYCNPTKTKYGWIYKGATNTLALHKRLKKQMMIRRLKKDVLKDLPKKSRKVIPFVLDDMSKYKKAEREFSEWLQNSKSKNKKKRPEALLKMSYLLGLAARYKLPMLYQWIDDFLEETDEKLVVYGIHKRVLKPLHNRYKKISVLVDGEVKDKKRHLHQVKFQNDPKCRIFFGNMIAAGEGITLTSSSNLLFAELTWTPGTILQVEDRIHRISQEKPCRIHYTVLKNSLEEMLCRLIQNKQRIINQILDGKKEIDDRKLNLHNELLKKFKKGA